MSTIRAAINKPGIFLALLLVIAVAAAVVIAPRLFAAAPAAQSPALIAQADSTGFAHVTGPIPLTFPADHGPHPAYQTEWWYYTGNLAAADGHRFGYQLTFFRRALVPLQQQVQRASDWATDQVYLAHFALTDVGRQDYHAQAELNRGAAGLAGAQADPLRVWLGDWSATMSDDQTYHLSASDAGRIIDLTLVDTKGPILQGDHGYSQKGPQPGNASIYYSLTHMTTTGKVTSAGVTYDVSGLSWMDREFSTSALAPNQVGWDWFSLQLDNDTEMMFYKLRDDDGRIDPYSSGAIIGPDASMTPLKLNEFAISNAGSWTSLHSGAVYPSGWHIEVPSQQIVLDVTPLVADQEFNVSLTYWEGAVKITGSQRQQPLDGYGYVELTGYHGPAPR